MPRNPPGSHPFLLAPVPNHPRDVCKQGATCKKHAMRVQRQLLHLRRQSSARGEGLDRLLLLFLRVRRRHEDQKGPIYSDIKISPFRAIHLDSEQGILNYYPFKPSTRNPNKEGTEPQKAPPALLPLPSELVTVRRGTSPPARGKRSRWSRYVRSEGGWRLVNGRFPGEEEEKWA